MPLEERQVTYFARWLKKKKKPMKPRTLETDAERPVSGWHMHHSVAILPGAVGSKLGWHLRYWCHAAHYTAREGS